MKFNYYDESDPIKTAQTRYVRKEISWEEFQRICREELEKTCAPLLKAAEKLRAERDG